MKTSPNSEQTIEIAFRDNILDLSKSNNEWSKRTIWKIWKNQIKNQFYINCKFFVLMRQRTKNRTFQRTGWIYPHTILFYELPRTNQTKHSKGWSHFFNFLKISLFRFSFISNTMLCLTRFHGYHCTQWFGFDTKNNSHKRIKIFFSSRSLSTFNKKDTAREIANKIKW